MKTIREKVESLQTWGVVSLDDVLALADELDAERDGLGRLRDLLRETIGEIYQWVCRNCNSEYVAEWCLKVEYLRGH